MEDIRKVDWKMIRQFLNKKIEQEDKNDFKPLLYIVITLVATIITCTILMSFKASAVELSQSVQFQGSLSVSSSSLNQDVGTCVTINQGTPYATNNGNTPCTIWGNIVIGSGTGFNTNYIWGINVYLYELRDREAIHGYINQNPNLLVLNYGGIIDSPSFMGYDVKNISESSVIVTYYFKSNTTNNLIANQSSFKFYPKFGIQTQEYMIIANQIEVWAISSSSGSGSVDNQGIINAIRQAETTNQQWLQTINTNLQNLMQNVQNNQGSINNINNNIQDSIDNTQQASDEGNANAQQSQSDNEQASQNIIGLIGSIINVFYTPAGNCSIPVDLGRGFDMGNINLCSGKPAEFAQIINLAGSIIIVYACYRVARTIFRLWIAMNVFGQGGKDNG